jgi:hypothetical protein
MRKVVWVFLIAALVLTTTTSQAATPNFIWNTGTVVQANPTLAGTSFTAPNTPANSHPLLGFIPSFTGVSNKRTYNFNVFPTDAQMPGLAYMKNFGFKVATPAK